LYHHHVFFIKLSSDIWLVSKLLLFGEVQHVTFILPCY